MNGTDCIATWKRNQGATTRGFFEAFKVPENDTSISFNSIDTISRAVSFTKKADEKKLVLGTRNQFGQAIVSWFQQLSDEKLQPTINEQQPLVPGAPPNANPKDKLMVGSYSFTVPYAALDQVKKLPDLMTIQKITLTYKERGDVKVEFTGKFYAI
ncbi:hypothetical protein ACHMW6_00325 (plasmid) [Pseudoduganella sp. UC29_106]|uniref:hypothetical protein n=1 Tax=Pseudoduganella sp. UC29_106 TaxID=3374553 RepID=UPI0037562FF0